MVDDASSRKEFETKQECKTSGLHDYMTLSIVCCYFDLNNDDDEDGLQNPNP